MSRRLEIEQKFFCSKKDNILSYIQEEGFVLSNEGQEKDEYFTDLCGDFIENWTCLRIRTTDELEMELTFKGKSKVLSSAYAKEEINIPISIQEHDHLKKILESLGYYLYSYVNKHRYTYTKTKEVTYNIMIDEIEGIGNFIEFEILSDQEEMSTLKEKLQNFVNSFDFLHLEVAKLPYRDFVADHLYKQTFPDKITNIIVDGNLPELLVTKLSKKGCYCNHPNQKNTIIIKSLENEITVNDVHFDNIVQVLLMIYFYN